MMGPEKQPEPTSEKEQGAPPDTESVARQAQFQVRGSVYCRRCAYDLRGLSADGRCPECGLQIWPSIIHLADPAAAKLPRLRDPRGVGNALVWLLGCALASTILLAAGATLVALEIVPRSGVRLGVLVVPYDLTLLAGLSAIAGLWSVFKFMPPRGSAPDVAVRRELWILAGASVLWGAAAIVLWQRERTWAMRGMIPTTPGFIAVISLIHMLLAVAGVFALQCLRGVLETIGRRSREFRRAQGGRQHIKPMIVATLGIVAGSGLRFLSAFGVIPDRAYVIGTIVVWVSVLMLMIGLAYLLANAWWIRRALRKPPPRLADLLRPVQERPNDSRASAN